MRIFGAGSLAAVALGLAVSTTGGQERPRYSPKPTLESNTAIKPVDNGSWWSNLFGGNNGDVELKKEPQAPTPTVVDKAMEQDRLMKAYLRRLDVCDKLRDVAHESSNERLTEEANRLEDLAWRLYQKQSSKLLGISTAAADEVPLEEKPAQQSTLDVLRSAKTGGNVPPRLRSGGKIEPTRAEVPASRKEDQR